MKETEKKYLLAIVKSIQTIQDCLFEVARRLEELEKDKQVKNGIPIKIGDGFKVIEF